jgi:hypothetical protein
MFMCLNINFKFILKGLLMKKFLFLFIFSLFSVNVSAQVAEDAATYVPFVPFVDGPSTPVPPIPTEPILTEPVMTEPIFVPQGPVIDLPLLPPIDLPIFPQIDWPEFPNIIPPFLDPPLAPIAPIPDPIGNNEPPLLTQSYCNDLRNQIYEIQSELMPLYMQFNSKRLTISGTKAEIKAIDELLDELNTEVITLSLQNKPVPADLRNQISNRVNWRVWLQERINRLEDEIIPIERDIDFWESFLPALYDAMNKAGCL